MRSPVILVAVALAAGRTAGAADSSGGNGATGTRPSGEQLNSRALRVECVQTISIPFDTKSPYGYTPHDGMKAIGLGPQTLSVISDRPPLTFATVPDNRPFPGGGVLAGMGARPAKGQVAKFEFVPSGENASACVAYSIPHWKDSGINVGGTLTVKLPHGHILRSVANLKIWDDQGKPLYGEVSASVVARQGGRVIGQINWDTRGTAGIETDDGLSRWAKERIGR